MERTRKLSTKLLVKSKSTIISPAKLSALIKSPRFSIQKADSRVLPPVPSTTINKNQVRLDPLRHRSTVVQISSKKLIQKHRKTLSINPSQLSVIPSCTPRSIENPFLKASFVSRTGRIDGKLKANNQDSLLVLPSLSHIVLAVFDGHGSQGHLISTYLQKSFSDLLTSLQIPDTKSPQAIFYSLFSETIKSLIASLKSSPLDSVHSGSTLLSVFIHKDLCICASIGDSKAVLVSADACWRGKALNKLHLPSDKEEKSRVLRAGGMIGQVFNDIGSPSGPLRVLISAKNGVGLALTRSIGDGLFKDFGVCDTPDFSFFKLGPADKCFVVATDGLWDYVDEKLVAELVRRVWEFGDPEMVVNELMRVVDEKAGSENVDDVSVIVGFRV